MNDNNKANDDINEFLQGVLDKVSDVDAETHRMFKMLVNTTLQYRDELHDKGEHLTVGQTQQALDAFMQVMKTHEIPANLNDNSHQLVVKWLEEIKKNVHN